MKSKNTDRLTELLLEVAIKTQSPDALLDLTREAQKLLVSSFAIYMVLTAQEHEDHKECAVKDNLRNLLELFKEQFMEDVDKHVEINLKVNGFTLDPSHNEKTRAEILKELEGGS